MLKNDICGELAAALRDATQLVGTLAAIACTHSEMQEIEGIVNHLEMIIPHLFRLQRQYLLEGMEGSTYEN